MAESETHDEEPTTFTDPTEHDGLIGILLKIRSSLLLFIAGFGVILLILGVVISNGVVAGLLGIWGVTALVYAGLGFVFLHVIGYR